MAQDIDDTTKQTLFAHDETLVGSLNRLENLKNILRKEYGLEDKDELFIIDREGTRVSLEIISIENGIRLRQDAYGVLRVMDFPVATIQARINGHVMTVIQVGRELEMPKEAYDAYLSAKAIGQDKPVQEVQVKVRLSHDEAALLEAQLKTEGCLLSEAEDQTDEIYTPPGHSFPPVAGTTTHRLRTARTANGDAMYTHTIKTLQGNTELNKMARNIRLHDKHAAGHLAASWHDANYQHRVTVHKERRTGRLAHEDVRIHLDTVTGIDGIIVELAGRANIVSESTIETRLLFLLRKLGLGKAPRLRQGLDTVIYNKEHGIAETEVA